MVQPITDKVYLIKCLEMLYSYKSVLYPSLPFIYQISIFSGIVAVVFSSVVLHTCVDTADSWGLVGVEGVRQVSCLVPGHPAVTRRREDTGNSHCQPSGHKSVSLIAK